MPHIEKLYATHCQYSFRRRIRIRIRSHTELYFEIHKRSDLCSGSMAHNQIPLRGTAENGTKKPSRKLLDTRAYNSSGPLDWAEGLVGSLNWRLRRFSASRRCCWAARRKMLAFKVLYAAQRSTGYSNASHGKRVSIRTFRGRFRIKIRNAGDTIISGSTPSKNAPMRHQSRKTSKSSTTRLRRMMLMRWNRIIASMKT